MKSGSREPGTGSQPYSISSSSRAASADCCARWRAGARFIGSSTGSGLPERSRGAQRTASARGGRRADIGGVPAGLRARGNTGGRHGPTHHHDGRLAQPRSVAAGVYLAPPERRLPSWPSTTGGRTRRRGRWGGPAVRIRRSRLVRQGQRRSEDCSPCAATSHSPRLAHDWASHPSSRVLAIVSEGVTDPEVWRTAIAGR